jgi:hypothetical protein
VQKVRYLLILMAIIAAAVIGANRFGTPREDDEAKP